MGTTIERDTKVAVQSPTAAASRRNKSAEIPSATVRIPPKTEATPAQGGEGGGG
ncbi:MAG: hypothetical protein HC897_15100 [Thermoanaerobaculia bacterium]|nr:hypothetical protein [Thermoanaerobaculia bacterium]